MLQPGERIDDHDKVCAEYYSALKKMGAYDDEYAFFGTVYLEEGHHCCFISTDREKTYAFARRCREREIYPTVVENTVKRLRVNAGEKEKIGQQLKAEYAEELKIRYPKDFLADMQKIAMCPINQRGAKIVDAVRDELEGCFDEYALGLFAGILEMAYLGKSLSAIDYSKNMQWLKTERDFLAERSRPGSHFRRKLTGFAYQKDGRIKYYSNAVEARTREKHQELLCAGSFAGPIYEKDYYFNFFYELPKCLDNFDTHLKERMDEGYLRLLRDLWDIKPQIDATALQALESRAEAWGNDALKTVKFYKTLWHIESI